LANKWYTQNDSRISPTFGKGFGSIDHSQALTELAGLVANGVEAVVVLNQSPDDSGK